MQKRVTHIYNSAFSVLGKFHVVMPVHFAKLAPLS